MINYIEKGIGLHKAIQAKGHTLSQVDGEWVASDDNAVQAIIDSYDPKGDMLPALVSEINKAAGDARIRYSTNIPFQEASYQAKEVEARRYKEAGYPDDLTEYPFTYAESAATGMSPKEAADSIISIAENWYVLLAEIERLRRKGIVSLEIEQDYKNLESIAEEYISQLEGV